MQINLIFKRKVFHPLASFWKWKLLELRKLRNGLLIHPQSQSKWKTVWRPGTITLIIWPSPTGAPRTSKLIRSDLLTARFILEIGQWGSNGPPSVILGGPFSRKGVQERGHQIQIHWVLFETFDILHGSDSSDALPPFCNILGNWESLGSNYTAESRMFVWRNNDSKEEEKGNWYGKRL